MEDPKSLMFLRRALRKRENYMNQAYQSFPDTTKKALHGSFKIRKKEFVETSASMFPLQ